MSADQETLDGETVPWYLTKRAERITHTMCRAEDLKSREYWCTECSCRVTRSLDRSKEYGHAPSCEHKIARTEGNA